MSIADVEERQAGSVAALDALLSSDGLYDLQPEQVEQLRVEHIRAAAEWHVERNPYYAAYCARAGFHPDQIRTTADLGKVPLVPSAMFKRGAELIGTSAGSDVIHTTSSGTQGTVSLVPRDDQTLMRFFASVAIGLREVFGLESSNVRLFNIGPSSAEHLWIAYVMSGVSLAVSGRSYTVDDRLLIDDLLHDLETFGDEQRAFIVGPPPLLLQLAEVFEVRGAPRLAANSLVVTIGGWKRARGTMPPRAEYDERVTNAFGLGVDRLRDTYNMVELNSVMLECHAKRKHVPPWLWVAARDPRTLETMESGGSGIISFADPTASSYPGFVLSDDFGSVIRNESCECGRTGDIVQLERRINRIEARGCALKLDMRSAAQNVPMEV